MIFVGGVHGVGKTKWCNELSSSIGLVHHSASTLIAQEKKVFFTGDKRVDQIEENQQLLLNAVKRIRNSSRLLLDGHFCLINKSNEIERVPYQTFVGLDPTGIIVLKDDVRIIRERLGSRDGRYYDLLFLERFQNEEIEYAQYISEELHCPIRIITQTDTRNLSNFINQCCKEGSQ